MATNLRFVRVVIISFKSCMWRAIPLVLCIASCCALPCTGATKGERYTRSGYTNHASQIDRIGRVRSTLNKQRRKKVPKIKKGPTKQQNHDELKEQLESNGEYFTFPTDAPSNFLSRSSSFPSSSPPTTPPSLYPTTTHSTKPPTPIHTAQPTSAPTSQVWNNLETYPLLELELSIIYLEDEFQNRNIQTDNLEIALVATLMHFLCRLDHILLARHNAYGIGRADHDADADDLCLVGYDRVPSYVALGGSILGAEPDILKQEHRAIASTTSSSLVASSSAYKLATWTLHYDVLAVGVTFQEKVLETDPDLEDVGLLNAALETMRHFLQYDLDTNIMNGKFGSILSPKLSSKKVIVSPVGHELEVMTNLQNAELVPEKEESVLGKEESMVPGKGWDSTRIAGSVLLFFTVVLFCALTYLSWKRRNRLREMDAEIRTGVTNSDGLVRSQNHLPAASNEDANSHQHKITSAQPADLLLIVNSSSEDPSIISEENSNRTIESKKEIQQNITATHQRRHEQGTTDEYSFLGAHIYGVDTSDGCHDNDEGQLSSLGSGSHEWRSHPADKKMDI